MGSRFQKGINDLKTWCEQHGRMDLLMEWNYDKNDNLIPENVSYGSHKEVFWKCSKCGNEYIKQIHSRAQGTGCGVCSGVGVFEHRGKLFEEYPELINELDASKNTYDDVKDVSASSKTVIYWLCDSGHSYEMPALVKTKSKGCPYCRNKRVLIGFNDLATWCKDKNRTQILDDWDYNKNVISPTQVTWGSNRKVWFKCHICGYEWKTTINSRSSANTDCRMCSRRISSSFPEQCVYYYFSKCFSDVINGDTAALKGLELDIYVPSMKFAVEYDGGTWHKDTKRDLLKDQRCEENDIILYRIRESDCESLITRSSVSFEYRYGDWDSLSEIIKSILNDLNVFDVDIDVSRDEYKIKEQYYLKSLDNSLQKLYPQIAAEWHPTKNGNITPDVVIAETHDEYYWLCPSCGHTYKAMVKNRVRMHSGCPKCGKAKASKAQMNKVINLDTGEIFDNITLAAEKYGLKRDALGMCCRGITQTSGGYKWAYYERGSRPQSISDKKQQPIINLDTQEIYESLNEATRKTKIHNISACCRGMRASAGGFRWAFWDVDSGTPVEVEKKYSTSNFERNYVVENITTGEIFDSLKEAGDKYHLTYSVLSQACRGITKKPVAGCYWRYSEIRKRRNGELTGQSKQMKNGQKAVVISDNGPRQIDIQFEDGNIVHTTRQLFKNGKVRNPIFDKKIRIEKSIQKSIEKSIEKAVQNHINAEKRANSRKSKDVRLVENTRKSIVGTTCVMKSGETAVCIKDNGWKDIDIKFEDGTVVEHVIRRNFISGSVVNPNYIRSFVGTKRRMECGLNCEIIDIRSKTDVTVKFENGDIVEHTTLLKFNRGTILTCALSHNYKYRSVGERKLMNCGEYAAIIADRGAHDIDVQFDDGMIVKHRDRSSFDNGTIQHPKTKTNYVGKVGVMRNGMKATVIADNGWDNIDVQFEDGKTVYHKRRSHFDDGRIAHE